MPGFLSWISGLFSSDKPGTVSAPESRLLNSAVATENNSTTDPALIDQLEEHLFSWLLDSPPTALHSEPGQWEPILENLRGRIARRELDELPRQPMTLPKLMRALSDDTSDRNHLTEIILNDPALTEQLLQIANSPYFRPGDQSIDSVDQAVFVLGLDGIRNVISASIMRPMMAARNSREALFAQRVWRWGLTCARSAELIAKIQGQDSSVFFMTGLLPALSYITLRRELQRICRMEPGMAEPSPSLIHDALSRYQWATSQLLANEWNLPPKYHAQLLAAERPAPGQKLSPLNDGIIVGTREVLRHAHQRNMPEEDVLSIIHISGEQFTRVRKVILEVLEAGSKARA
ncbi:HDOD domain-containing protein [Marinobacter orientalis]|uniref:HDOD domain-containing protein n=1 Tax=Marinobacter orientalis TaxID=1928859 RepID=A0A7Y0NK69_9GAMM|nr:HDOD domain-containing protein [Marinobacter orientalis]NMT62018.1 HDOD domain-containing protein [Marinobacter orientalis]TGX50746.1 HDOD domain-containing protein [Marinobacter orientalis]